MVVSDHINVIPHTRDALLLAYSRGIITYETLYIKLTELKNKERDSNGIQNNKSGEWMV